MKVAPLSERQSEKEKETEEETPVKDYGNNATSTQTPESTSRDSVSVTESSDQLPLAEVNPNRKGWGRRIEFLIAMLGTCVGLGNVWRFPYICYKNGGGAFLIPYLIMMFAIGLPVFYLESALGQFSSLSIIAVFKFSPYLKGLAYGTIIVVFLVSVYYNVLNCHFLYYIFLSMREPLPWGKCYEWWNPSPCCLDCLKKNDTSCAPYNRNLSASANCTSYKLAAEEYYSKVVLQLTDGIDNFGYPVWQIVLCLLAVWILIAAAVSKGAQTFGKAVYFTSIFPYVMLTVMLIRGATLEGAGDGVLYFITPNFTRLGDLSVWQDAAGQVFYSVSVSCGQLVSMSSYNQFDHPLLRDSILIVFLDMCTSIFSGFVVFTVLGYMAKLKDLPLDEVVTAGPGLVFEVYPSALATMPIAPLWSILFFMMLLSLGLGSAFTQCETIQLTIQDEFYRFIGPSKRRQLYCRFAVCLVLFCCGFPMTFQGGIYLLTIIDESTGAFVLLFIGLAECIVIAHIYGVRRYCDDIKFMTGVKPSLYFVACWLVITPLALFVMLMMNIVDYKVPKYDDYVFPDWALGISAFFIALPMIPVPLWFFYYFCVKQKAWVILGEGAKPLEGWGPADPDVRKRYMEQNKSKYTFQSPSKTVRAYVAKVSANSQVPAEVATARAEVKADDEQDTRDRESGKLRSGNGVELVAYDDDCTAE